MKTNKIAIGTRGSKLALWQAEWIRAELEKLYPDLEIELVKIKTTGDKILDVPLAQVGGKGLFVKEIEEALLRREVDIAVHSMKDVPTEFPDNLHLAVICKREDPRDAVIAGEKLKVKSEKAGRTSGCEDAEGLVAAQPRAGTERHRGARSALYASPWLALLPAPASCPVVLGGRTKSPTKQTHVAEVSARWHRNSLAHVRQLLHALSLAATAHRSRAPGEAHAHERYEPCVRTNFPV